MAHSKGQQLPEGWVPISTYFCIENSRILGAIRLRHGTNKYVNNVIGHVGYETRPTARGQGVAKRLLLWLKENKLKNDVILICSESNLASRRMIEGCGGRLMDSFIDTYQDTEENGLALRYKL